MTIEASAYLFDLDGTLVDTAPDIAAALNAALGSAPQRALTAAEVRPWVGKGARFLVKLALDHRGANPSTFESLLSAFLAHYERYAFVASSIYPGVTQTLETLKSRGRPLAVVTNKPASVSRPLLASAALAGYFDLILCSDEVKQGKPAPDLLLGACAALGIEPERSLMVGDSSHDVAAARAAGCPVVCVSYGYNHGAHIEEARPDRIVDSLLELL